MAGNVPWLWTFVCMHRTLRTTISHIFILLETLNIGTWWSTCVCVIVNPAEVLSTVLLSRRVGQQDVCLHVWRVPLG